MSNAATFGERTQGERTTGESNAVNGHARTRILVTGNIPRAGLDGLFERFDVTYSQDPDNPFTREWILEHGAGYQGILVMGQRIDKVFIDAMPDLEVVSLDSVGFDNVDLDYAKQRGVTISNSPQAIRVPTAELTFGLILAAAKRFAFYDNTVRGGAWLDTSHVENQGVTLEGRTLGIFGFGRVGQTVAGYGHAFGMKVIYHNDRRLSPIDEARVESELGARYVSFDELLAQSDVLSIHTPLTAQTRGVFGASAFERMKDTAYLINAARGPIMEESALVEALRNNTIAGAGLDVFEFEPHVSAELRGMSNVFMTPHAGTGTKEAKENLAREAAGNLVAFFDGQPRNIVNL